MQQAPDRVQGGGYCCKNFRRPTARHRSAAARHSSTPPMLLRIQQSMPGSRPSSRVRAGPAYLGGELFKAMTGTRMVHVPYKGSAQAINDLVSGNIEVMFDNVPSIGPHVKSGRVRTTTG